MVPMKVKEASTRLRNTKNRGIGQTIGLLKQTIWNIIHISNYYYLISLFALFFCFFLGGGAV